MSCINRSNKVYLKRKDLSRAGFGVLQARSLVVHKPLTFLLGFQNEHPQYLFASILSSCFLYLIKNMKNSLDLA